MVNIVILLLTGSVTRPRAAARLLRRIRRAARPGRPAVDEAGPARDEGERREGDEWHDWHESHMESRGVSSPKRQTGRAEAMIKKIEAGVIDEVKEHFGR